MSALPPVPKGHAFFALELDIDGCLRFLAAAPATPSRPKVKLKAKVQPMRRTRAASNLFLYCIPARDTTPKGLYAIGCALVAHIVKLEQERHARMASDRVWYDVGEQKQPTEMVEFTPTHVIGV